MKTTPLAPDHARAILLALNMGRRLPDLDAFPRTGEINLKSDMSPEWWLRVLGHYRFGPDMQTIGPPPLAELAALLESWGWERIYLGSRDCVYKLGRDALMVNAKGWAYATLQQLPAHDNLSWEAHGDWRWWDRPAALPAFLAVAAGLTLAAQGGTE